MGWQTGGWQGPTLIPGSLTFWEMPAAPPLSPVGACTVYFDATENRLKISENGGAYTLIEGAAVGVANVWTDVQSFQAGIDIEYSTLIFNRLALSSAGLLSLKATEIAPTACTATLAGAGAGNVNTGTHSYKITFVTAGGETEAGAVSGTVTTTG